MESCGLRETRTKVASHGNATPGADTAVEDDSHIDYDLDDRPWMADAWAAQTEAARNLANGS